MEVNWCEREDTEDKETTEIVTKASNASMGIYRGCKTAQPWQSHLHCWSRAAGRSTPADTPCSCPFVPFPIWISRAPLIPDSSPLGLEELVQPVTSVTMGRSWMVLAL